jgi:hypothetical protein
LSPRSRLVQEGRRELQNYEAIISQHTDCNDDPFGQDVEQVPKNNILKNGNDPTVNKGDQATTTPL